MDKACRLLFCLLIGIWVFCASRPLSADCICRILQFLNFPLATTIIAVVFFFLLRRTSSCRSADVLSKVFWDQVDPVVRSAAKSRNARWRWRWRAPIPHFGARFATERSGWSTRSQKQSCRAGQELSIALKWCQLEQIGWWWNGFKVAARSPVFNEWRHLNAYNSRVFGPTSRNQTPVSRSEAALLKVFWMRTDPSQRSAANSRQTLKMARAWLRFREFAAKHLIRSTRFQNRKCSASKDVSSSIHSNLRTTFKT